jgi:hypothetical protein
MSGYRGGGDRRRPRSCVAAAVHASEEVVWVNPGGLGIPAGALVDLVENRRNDPERRRCSPRHRPGRSLWLRRRHRTLP